MSQATDQLYEESIETLPTGFQQKFSEHFGIVCFTENSTSLAMWGHYASCHEGFAVEFDPTHGMFPPDEFARISYSKTRPHLEAKEHWRILLAKSDEWEREAEHRLIKPLASLQKAKRRDGKEKHYLELSPNAIRSVHLGCRMPEPNRNEILDALKGSEWKHVTQFAMRRHCSDYAIEPVPVEKLKPIPQDALQDFYGLWKAIGL